MGFGGLGTGMCSPERRAGEEERGGWDEGGDVVPGSTALEDCDEFSLLYEKGEPSVGVRVYVVYLSALFPSLSLSVILSTNA